MGGPCFLLSTAPERKVTGPPATDNFAVQPFTFDGTLWQSVEQCYQAHKLLDATMREVIRLMVPRPGETDFDYGMRVWRAGNRNKGQNKYRDDWDAVKIEVMLRACRSKYAAHEELRAQLLGTGDARIVGGPSTEWKGASGRHGWSDWNGKIQELLREELRQVATGAAPSEKLRELEAALSDYMRAEGGAKHPLPQGSELAGTAAAATLQPPPPPQRLATLDEEADECADETSRRPNHHLLLAAAACAALALAVMVAVRARPPRGY